MSACWVKNDPDPPGCRLYLLISIVTVRTQQPWVWNINHLDLPLVTHGSFDVVSRGHRVREAAASNMAEASSKKKYMAHHTQ